MLQRSDTRDYLRHAAIYFFYFFSSAMFSAMLSVYLSDIGLRTTEISLVASGAGVFTMALQPFFGMVYDRLGRGRLLSVLLLCGSAVTGVLFSLTRSVPALFILCGLSMALINSVGPYFERMAAASMYRYGVLRSWAGIGGALAPQVSGIVLERFHPVVNFSLFAAGAVITAVCLCSIGRMSDGAEKKRGVSAAQGGQGGFLTRQFLLYALVSFLFNGVTGAGRTVIPLMLKQMTGSASVVGSILLGATLMEIPIIVFSNRFMDRLTGRTLLVLAIGVTFAEYVVYSLSPGTMIVCAATLMTKSVTTMLFIMINLKIVMDIVGGGRVMTALSLMATVNQVASVVFTWLAGILAERCGMRLMFAVLAAALIAALALCAALRLPRRQEGYFSGHSRAAAGGG